ncbi:MAG: type III-A CRISPR-associated RAMP protein Csm3 [Candidatus Cloacimonadota bacterium]|nr:MAG: type III-A CRISPR-associated RAMP protein Csm3 [Candidatus Cloacimonadota bacterium]PIE78643.1 MAG: type III-A CRISPR-associated RAMP protein Csm3 [Candidatus Delongbacteria bacterium]
MIKVLTYSGEIEVLSGLHIGAGNEAVEIGGSDSPIIKTKEGYPYIPGSSIKGRMRWLLEKTRGEHDGHNPGNKPDIWITSKLFGSTAENCTPTRTIFRDCLLTKESLESFKDGVWDIELKMENTIDRITGKTKGGGLRNCERVPAGVKFDFSMNILLFEGDDEEEVKKVIEEGFELIELTYLGGSGTRGYGKISLNSPKWEQKEFNK